MPDTTAAHWPRSTSTSSTAESRSCESTVQTSRSPNAATTGAKTSATASGLEATMTPRHATDVVSLVAGTIFAGFTAVWLLTISDTIDETQAWVGFPIIMITAGVLGLVAALTPKKTTDPTAEYAEEQTEP